MRASRAATKQVVVIDSESGSDDECEASEEDDESMAITPDVKKKTASGKDKAVRKVAQEAVEEATPEMKKVVSRIDPGVYTRAEC